MGKGKKESVYIYEQEVKTLFPIRNQFIGIMRILLEKRLKLMILFCFSTQSITIIIIINGYVNVIPLEVLNEWTKGTRRNPTIRTIRFP